MKGHRGEFGVTQRGLEPGLRSCAGPRSLHVSAITAREDERIRLSSDQFALQQVHEEVGDGDEAGPMRLRAPEVHRGANLDDDVVIDEDPSMFPVLLGRVGMDATHAQGDRWRTPSPLGVLTSTVVDSVDG
jgi:hypothetical protein